MRYTQISYTFLLDNSGIKTYSHFSTDSFTLMRAILSTISWWKNLYSTCVVFNDFERKSVRKLHKDLFYTRMAKRGNKCQEMCTMSENIKATIQSFHLTGTPGSRRGFELIYLLKDHK